jgi:predicted transcriptional regulator
MTKVRAAPGRKVPVTVRLDEGQYRRLAALASAENRSPANFLEAAVLRDLDARDEASRVLTMHVAADAEEVAPGPLVRTEGEPDLRYEQRAALMDRLFAIPDTP